MIGNSVAGVRPGVYAALATGLAVVVLRLLRRETVQQAVSGLLGLGLAAFLAVRFRGGDGSGFFLSGVLFSALYCLLFLGSAMIRRPLVGIIAAAVEGRGRGWRDEPKLVRAYTIATLGWSVIFGVRAVVQGALIAAEAEVEWLGVAKLALGYPVTIAAVAVTLLYLRRSTRGTAAAAAAAAAEAGGTDGTSRTAGRLGLLTRRD